MGSLQVGAGGHGQVVIVIVISDNLKLFQQRQRDGKCLRCGDRALADTRQNERNTEEKLRNTLNRMREIQLIKQDKYN